MQNLNQIRARNVVSFANDPHIDIQGKNGGEVIKKIPPAIMNNGLLATLAYSLEKKRGGDTSNPGWKAVFDGIACHLSCPEINIAPNCTSGNDLIEFLVQPSTTSDVLRAATDEAMAWLEFARRLVH